MVVLAGIDSSEIVDAALADTALTEVAVPRFEPGCSPPCDALLWRLETACRSKPEPARPAGALLAPVALRADRTAGAISARIRTVPEILDEGTLGTRGSALSFKTTADRLAMRFVRDAALGRGRGPAGTMAGLGSQRAAWLAGLPARDGTTV